MQWDDSERLLSLPMARSGEEISAPYVLGINYISEHNSVIAPVCACILIDKTWRTTRPFRYMAQTGVLWGFTAVQQWSLAQVLLIWSRGVICEDKIPGFAFSSRKIFASQMTSEESLLLDLFLLSRS